MAQGKQTQALFKYINIFIYLIVSELIREGLLLQLICHPDKVPIIREKNDSFPLQVELRHFGNDSIIGYGDIRLCKKILHCICNIYLFFAFTGNRHLQTDSNSDLVNVNILSYVTLSQLIMFINLISTSQTKFD